MTQHLQQVRHFHMHPEAAADAPLHEVAAEAIEHAKGGHAVRIIRPGMAPVMVHPHDTDVEAVTRRLSGKDDDGAESPHAEGAESPHAEGAESQDAEGAEGGGEKTTRRGRRGAPQDGGAVV